MKIYSNRVDDTYSSSHRILESLSRNGSSAQDSNDHDDDENDDGEDGENNPEGGATGGRKKGNKTSTRLNIATTIERNVAALNAVKLENDVAVDPMFHKISKAFDEGGAKGMLMNNLVRAAQRRKYMNFILEDTFMNDYVSSLRYLRIVKVRHLDRHQSFVPFSI